MRKQSSLSGVDVRRRRRRRKKANETKRNERQVAGGCRRDEKKTKKKSSGREYPDGFGRRRPLVRSLARSSASFVSPPPPDAAESALFVLIGFRRRPRARRPWASCLCRSPPSCGVWRATSATSSLLDPRDPPRLPTRVDSGAHVAGFAW